MPDTPSPEDPSPEATESAAPEAIGFDPQLDAALKSVLKVIYRDHPLSPNQILVLASELQRLGVHRLVEEHIRKYSLRQADGRDAGG